MGNGDSPRSNVHRTTEPHADALGLVSVNKGRQFGGDAFAYGRSAIGRVHSKTPAVDDVALRVSRH